MARFIENVNAYLSQMRIKQTYISLKTGIDVKKLSRILTSVQEITVTDMEKISDALGRRPEYFLQECFEVPQPGDFMPEKIAFYAGSPTARQDEMAEKLQTFMENIDEVLSAKGRFLNMTGE